jgi:hypothetical protein
MWINIRIVYHLVAGIRFRVDVVCCGDLPILVSRSETV